MIVYKKTDGFAHDLRYEPKEYVLKLDDIRYSHGFEELPKLESLHDPLAVQTKLDAEATEKQRLDGLRVDVLASDMLDKLRSATPDQINSFVDNQVTDLASSKAMFKRILLVMALIANGNVR